MTRDDAPVHHDGGERHEHDHDRVIVLKRSGGISPFLIGLAVGAGLALLFAPASGAETRRRLARGARRMRRAATDAAEDVKDKVTDSFDAARERVAKHVDAVRDTVTSKRDHVERAVNEGRAAAQQARQDIEKRLAETKAAYQAGARVARERKTHDD